ncbi:MAG: DUF2284 domain-containing protein [Schwartzia sp.]|nr:DUF2284 domain-containing protein [Schwartzia sp. (in: firmicutes)]
MAYRVEYRTNYIGMAQFREKYQDRKKFMAFCRECPRYDDRWSCPPLSFDVDEFLAPYAQINLLCAKINLDEATIRAADTAEKIRTVGWDIVSTVKRDLEERLLKLETQIPGSLALASGGCTLCESCTRKTGAPCRQPDKMRYSLDAFGFDLTAITNDMFHIEILWCRDSLPKYFTLIHGLLANGTVSVDLWKSVGLSE